MVPPDTMRRARQPPTRLTPLRTLRLATRASVPILALGADLKASVCFYRGNEAAICGPLGNLLEPQNYRAFVRRIARFQDELGFSPELVAHDLHPLYLSTRYAARTGLPTIGVQHHHAHVVSVMAERQIDRPVIGICCDGVGYGLDGTAWGCEVMRCDAAGFARIGTLETFELIGGDAAAVETWRPAAALLRQAFGSAWRDALARLAHRKYGRAIPNQSDLDRAECLMERGIATARTSSLGRVFDGISFLLGLCAENRSEGQAARALEHACTDEPVEPYACETAIRPDGMCMSAAPTVRAVVADLEAGVAVPTISTRFHETLARMLAVTARAMADRYNLREVVLAGGCFVNRQLRSRLLARLGHAGLRAVCPGDLHYGDAALALGQAVVAGSLAGRRGG